MWENSTLIKKIASPQNYLCKMNFIDILIFIPLIYGGWQGFKKGFIVEIFTLLALLVGVYAGVHLSDQVTVILRDSANMSWKYLPTFSFILVFLMVGAMVYFLGKLVEKVIDFTGLKLINKLAGMFFGLVKFLYVISIVLLIEESFQMKGEVLPSEAKERSLLYSPVKNLSFKTIPAFEGSELF
jgi:membrane protein required for colicin V production